MNSKGVWNILAILGFGAAVLLLPGCEEEDVVGAFGSNTARAVERETAAWASGVSRSLVVETSNGAVRLRGKPGVQTASIVITKRSRGGTIEEARDRVDRIVVHVEQIGPELRLVYQAGDQDDDVRRASGVDFDVVLPEEIRIDARTSNGAVDLADVRGTIRLETSNGAIDVRRCEGTLFADTSNGRIEVVSFVGDAHAETSNGAVWIEDAIGSVDAETSNGSIRYEGTPAEDLGNRLRTSNGSITVRVDPALAIAFDAHAGGGRIRSNLPLTGDTEGEDWSAVLNPPARTEMELRTSNGSIALEAAP